MLAYGRYLDDPGCEKLRQGYFLYRCCYDRLANQAIEAHALRWKVRPKQHMLEHCIYDFASRAYLNPRFQANYMGEDMVRRCKALALASNPNFMSWHVLVKYILQMGIRHRVDR